MRITKHSCNIFIGSPEKLPNYFVVANVGWS
jgi:hypothetical protein